MLAYLILCEKKRGCDMLVEDLPGQDFCLVDVEDDLDHMGFMKKFLLSIIISILAIAVVFAFFTDLSFEVFVYNLNMIMLFYTFIFLAFLFFSHTPMIEKEIVYKKMFKDFKNLQIFYKKKFSLVSDNIYFLSGNHFIHVSENVVISHFDFLMAEEELYEHLKRREIDFLLLYL